MTVSLSQLSSAKSRRRKRVGRGDGSGRGTYSGRGLKGQRSRSGGKNKLKRRGLKQVLLQIPKSRGFHSMHASFESVNIEDLEKKYEAGAMITINNLKLNGLIQGMGRGVKVLGHGKLSKKLTVHAHRFSKTAEAAIKKAGGSVRVFELKKVNVKEKISKTDKKVKK